jgi:hypothetical protein
MTTFYTKKYVHDQEKLEIEYDHSETKPVHLGS